MDAGHTPRETRESTCRRGGAQPAAWRGEAAAPAMAAHAGGIPVCERVGRGAAGSGCPGRTDANMNEKNPSIAIVGMSCLFPKADDLQAYWANIKNGVNAITPLPTGS